MAKKKQPADVTQVEEHDQFAIRSVEQATKETGLPTFMGIPES